MEKLSFRVYHFIILNSGFDFAGARDNPNPNASTIKHLWPATSTMEETLFPRVIFLLLFYIITLN